MVTNSVTLSRPARGAWVEINRDFKSMPSEAMSRPARGAWVEIPPSGQETIPIESRPARGAWVEMMKNVSPNQSIIVAPRKGRVG